MFLNERMMPEELLYYKALAIRTDLTREEKSKMYSLQKGYEGECLYDKIFDEVGHENVYVFRDVYLRIENSVTQYDCIIISNDGTVVNEIKYYSGDYYFKENRFYKNEAVLSDNAFTQLNRSTGKLISLEKIENISLDVTGKVVFPNDDFRLYSENNSIWEDVVARSNLKKYMRNFSNEYIGDKAENIALLIRNYIVENPYFKNTAKFDRIKKGLYCGNCKSFILIKDRYHLACVLCNTRESKETHLLRAISDYKYLFHDQPLTSRELLLFIDNTIHQRTVQRNLLKHCTVNKKGNETQYTFKYYDFEEAMKITENEQKYKNYINA